jgi:HAD superfamily hydrolase (TIGR01549 family)
MHLKKHLEAKPKKHLIFDLDETILELLLPWDEWFAGIKAIIVVKDPELWTEYEIKKLNIHETVNEFVKRFGVQSKNEIVAFSEKFEVDRLTGIRPNLELIEFIKENKDNYEMYIWSSNTKAVIQKVLEHVGLTSHFKTIVSRNDVMYVKPNPIGFELVDDGTSHVTEYLFIGDSINDEGAAREMGIEFFKVAF